MFHGSFQPQRQGQTQFPCTHGQQSYPPNEGQQPSRVPDDNPDENPDPQPPSPSVPPLEEMDQFSGYENVDGTPLQPPPSYNEALRLPPPQSQAITTTVPVISEEQARSALLDHVSHNCCFGSKAAKKMKFTNIFRLSAFHYSLESYTEKRSAKWDYEPYHDQVIGGSFNGSVPSPWDIEARPPALFQSNTETMEVPHTASIKPCHDCIGLSRKRCYKCGGRGMTRCKWCNGNGYDCTFCHGYGKKRCSVCKGHGHTACNTCNARGKLKCFIRLTIEWNVHHDDYVDHVEHVVERTSLPDELIRTVSGETVFKQELPRVWPINHFPHENINEASKNLVQRHLNDFQATQKSLLNNFFQRQKIRVIPVASIYSNWNNNSFSYFVYGFEHKVHAPDYPQQCSCGCTLL
ncbi:protein SSUH2 homolog [Saccoglossus kowalevskii]